MDIDQIIKNIKNHANTLVANANNNCLGPWNKNFVNTICSNINELAYEVRSNNLKLYNDLQDIKSNLFFEQKYINIFMLGRLIQILRSYDYISTNDFWQYTHLRIIELCKNKFEDGYYSDTVQTALIELCSIVREYRKEQGLPEIPSDKDMMYNTFSTLKVLQFTDSSSISLKNIQEGYEKIFPAVIQAMRNPNAHHNSTIEKAEAVQKIMIVSNLMKMLDIAISNKTEELKQ